MNYLLNLFLFSESDRKTRQIWKIDKYFLHFFRYAKNKPNLILFVYIVLTFSSCLL